MKRESIEETKIAYNNIFNITNNQKIDLKQEDMIFVCKIFKDWENDSTMQK